MIKITELTYSKNDFKDILRTVTPIQYDTKTMDLDPFPNTADLAIFAKKTYSNKDDELSSGLPEGWELLTTVEGSRGYFGCVYFNPSKQQIVLAHRGTSGLKALHVDRKGVWRNKNTYYMFSAITLGDDIKRAILDLNKQDGVRFTLSITGHSLGGWISQVTAITLKHLKRRDSGFVRVSNIDEGIHAHTVVFDSPGVEDMAIKIQRDYGRYDSPYSVFRSLDISNFSMAVNLVNATGFHIGAMYQISSNLVCTSGYKHFLSNVTTHSMKNFTKAFEVGSVKLFQVKDWPQGWGERKQMHKLEKTQGTYYPETKGESSVRYNIGEEDPGTTVGLHHFSEVELDFVNLIRMVRQHEIPGSKIETFFGDEFQDLFPNFTINRTEKTVTLDSKSNLKKFVNNIKNSLRWFSGKLQDVMEEQKKLTIPWFLLDMYSQEYVTSIPNLPDCEDPLGLCEFTNNTDARVLYVQAADCSLEMARIYSILCNAYPEIECIFLNVESLLKLNKYLTTEGLPLNNNCNLFVFNIGSTTEIALVQEVLKNVFSKFNEYSKKKAVIVSQKNSVLFNFVKSFELELAIRCWPPSAQECLEFTFNDLKDTSRRELLSKDFIFLGEQPMSLNALLGENCQCSVSLDDVLKPLLKDVLTDVNFNLNIHYNLLKFDQLDVMFSKINREVNMSSLTKLLEETCSLVASSDVRQLLEPLLQEVAGAAEKVLYISGSSEEDFHQACLENSFIHVAYLLTATDGHFYLKEVYNRSFYLPRQFRHKSLVDLKKLAQKKNDDDLFVFVGVTDKATLMRYLNASPEVEELFSTNLKCKSFQDSTMAENAEGINRYVNKHTIEVVKEGEGYLLVWRDSQGALDSLLPCLSSRLLSEEELCACKTVIISALPGMGKSTTLTSLSRHMVNSWVLRINLRDRPADIKNLPAQMSVESVAHFLADAGSEPATLSLLRFCLQSRSSRQIHVLLDGFDEIRDKEAVEKILKLCHFLKNETSAKIIVTTRDSHKNVLENRLSTVTTIFKEITKEIQLSFLVNYWHSHAVLGQKEERLWLFAQHLYKAAHEKLGRDIIGLIGIPLHTRMLAEAFLLQAEEFIDNAEPHPDIIGINNIYSLYNKFIGVKRDIYLKEKISFSSFDSNSSCEMLIVNHYVLAFEILDPEFQKKYIVKGGINRDEMNRFGLTQWNRETHCDFIHRTFAEFFCSQLLVLWLRRENFSYKFLPIEEWFLGNLLINKDFKVVRKFMDEHLAEVTLAEESKQLLYDNMSKCWSKDAAAFCDENGETALHVAIQEGNTNIIDLLLGGLVRERTQEPFESFLLARDYDGKTALKTGLKILFPKNRKFVFVSNLLIEKGIKQMLNITQFSYELKYKLLLYTVFEDNMLSVCSKFLLTCALNEKDQEDIQKALHRIEVLQSDVLSKVPLDWHREQAIPKLIKNFILNEQNDIAERKFLTLARIHYKTAINIESSAGNYELVKQFIQINQDVVNSRDDSKMTPLYCATEGGHIELVKFLLQQRDRLNDHNSNGQTPLSCAAENGKQDIVKYLLKHGADSKLSDVYGKTPLHYAIEGGHVAIVKYLISEGKVDINCLDIKGRTPLIYAIEGSHVKIVQYLISEVKVDINCVDNEGVTPLIFALVGGKWRLAEYLLDSGADPNISDCNDKTSLMYAVERMANSGWFQKPSRLDIVKRLISFSKDITMDINKSDRHGMTPLYYAIEGGDEEIVKYLTSEVKVDINFLDNKGCTPLIYALMGRKWRLAEYLLDSGADPNISDCNDKTSLMYAVERMAKSGWFQKPSRLDIVKRLISLSKDITIDINKSDRHGKTLLHYAVDALTNYLSFCKHTPGIFNLIFPHYCSINSVECKVAEYLLKAGADPNILDHDGKTPLDNVTNEDILNYLKSIKTPSGDPIT